MSHASRAIRILRDMVRSVEAAERDDRSIVPEHTFEGAALEKWTRARTEAEALLREVDRATKGAPN